MSSYCCLKIPSIISGSRGECYAAEIEHEKGEDESEAEAEAELKRFGRGQTSGEESRFVAY